MNMSPEDAIKLWQEHSKQMWNRLQSIAVLEAGIITGWYKMFESERFLLGTAVLIVGSILLVIIGALINRDSQYMKAFLDVADSYTGDN